MSALQLRLNALKSLFLLDPNIIFLNHGSFGACPRPVFEQYQWWQRELERQPVEFLGRRFTTLMAEARTKLADYLGAAAGDILFFPNPTTALNMVARSLNLRLGDEILTTDHEYGAMDQMWKFICNKTGARYVRCLIPLSVSTHEEFVENFWSRVTNRTRVIFLSHITSPTALILPVQEICHRAREAGLLTVIDGAHAPGHLPLNLTELGADIYAGACHKWLCAPKGAAFLYARREVQSLLDPLVISWGWGDEAIPPTPGMGGTPFISFHEWQGTRDPAAFLTVPAAIQFQVEHNWDDVRRKCFALARETRNRLNALTGLAPLCPDSPERLPRQLFAVRLPDSVDVEAIKARLYDEFRIEAPVYKWADQNLMRISLQGYNSQEDAEALIEATKRLLSGVV
jgi:isopenicillin-N epimerase